MVDIFSIPVYYISFTQKPDLEKTLVQIGFKNVNHFQAIDGRKMDPHKLLDGGRITVRAYVDLKTGREQPSGIPSMGSIGCTLSHCELWKKCIQQQLPYIIVLEDDVVLHDLTGRQIQNIQNAISVPNGVFVSADVTRDIATRFYGAHFCVISRGACEQLVTNVFPIDVQVDSYMANMDTLKRIHIEGYPIGKQSIHKSTIQAICIKCMLPKNVIFYVSVVVMVLLLIGLCILYRRWYGKCGQSLEICRNTPYSGI
jgi:hypothetical protein